jgi:hypothetical protein
MGKRKEPGPIVILAWLCIALIAVLLVGCAELATAVDGRVERRVDIVVNNMTADPITVFINGEAVGTQMPGSTRYRPRVLMEPQRSGVSRGTAIVAATNQRTGRPSRQRTASVSTDRPESVEFRDTDFR